MNNNLHNKKVKINVNSYKKAELSDIFINFIEENEDTVFTAKEIINMPDIYKLEGNDIWRFHELNLIKV